MMLPFQLDLTPQAFRGLPGAQAILRRLADVVDIFGDAEEASRILARDNPLIYEFIDLRQAVPGSRMSFGLTVIQPGTVGEEFYMTRGHFHAASQDGDELYIGVRGAGLLQLQSRQGDSREVELRPGGLVYTPLAWAHRTVNTGREPLVFFSAWPASTAYDYEEISRRGGFPQRVVRRNEQALLTHNPSFKR